MTTATEVRAVAVAAYKVGLCVLPAAADGSKRPGVSAWAEYQRERPSSKAMQNLFPHAGGPQGLGFVCGAVSGNLELLEFDDVEAEQAFRALAIGTDVEALIEILDSGYSERTPGGGLHWLYRCPEIAGNTKLAQQPCCALPRSEHPECGHAYEVRPLIETRGEGGWVVVAPSGGPTHPSGGAYEIEGGGVDSIPTLEPEERAALWELARTLDAMPDTSPPCLHCGRGRNSHPDGLCEEYLPDGDHLTAAPIVPSDADERPGDAFNRTATWAEVLEPHGWRVLDRRGPITDWLRPGAKTRIKPDATTGAKGTDYLYVFSTSVAEFEAERGYDKFGAYAILNYGGDTGAAARALAAEYDLGITPLVAPHSQRDVILTPAPANASTAPVANPFTGEIDEDATPPTVVPFASAFPVGHFVTDWIAYASEQSDAPYEYHEAVALALLSTCVPGVKAYLTPWPNGLAANLYFMLLGHSSSSRKSTAMKYGSEVLAEVYADAITPTRMTPEALIEQLARRVDGASFWKHDEIGKALGEWAARRNASGEQITGHMLSAYDGEPIHYARRSKRQQGSTEVSVDEDRVSRSHLVILGATTPAIYESERIDTMATDGLLPRFAIVLPRSRPPHKDVGPLTDVDTRHRNSLAVRLASIRAWALTGGIGIRAELEPAALRLFNAYDVKMQKQAEVYPILARLAAMAIKVAILSAAGAAARGTPLDVLAEDMRAGIAVADRWAQNAIEFMDELRGMGHTPQAARAAQALAYVRRKGGTCPRRDVMRALHLTARECDELEATLRQSGQIIAGQAPGETRKGPETAIWQVTSSDK